MLQFVQLKNEYALGYLSDEVMLVSLETLNIKDSDEQNQIVILINRIKYQLSQEKPFVKALEKLPS